MNGDAKQPETGNWQFKPGDADPQTPQAQATAEQNVAPVPVQQAIAVPLPEEHPEVSWTASEFIAHEKSPLWYLALIGATVGLAAIVVLITHDKVSTVVIVIVGIIFGITAGRQPRSLQYLLDKHGITVNRAFRPYGDFKSFALVKEGTVNSIIFMPLKRFTLPLSVYVGSDETNDVVTKLSDYLPLDQNHGHDAIDRFIQRIRF
jgi:hypothetical protein